MDPLTRPSWERYYLDGALWASGRADCTRAQVGAILVSDANRVLSIGYNGLLAGVPGCASAGNCPRGRLTTEECKRDSDYANCASTHAERNAIEHAPPERLPGSTLYTSRQPCPACSTLILSVGVARVVWPGEGEQIEEWIPLF